MICMSVGREPRLPVLKGVCDVGMAGAMRGRLPLRLFNTVLHGAPCDMPARINRRHCCRFTAGEEPKGRRGNVKTRRLAQRVQRNEW